MAKNSATCRYATFSYDVAAGSLPVDEVRADIIALFKLTPSGTDRLRCDLLSDTFICRLESDRDYFALVRALRNLREDLSDQFQFVITRHEKNHSTLRNAGQFVKHRRDRITRCT